MRDSGLRGRFAYGPALGMPNDKTMDLADIARMKKEIGTDPMLTLGICSRNVMATPAASAAAIDAAMAKKEWGAARELGLPITLHTSGTGAVKLLEDAGLLGPDVQLVHPLHTTRRWEAHPQARGVHYSDVPPGESRRGAGEIQVAEMLQAGVKVSISIDNNTTASCDCFVCMRMLQTLQLAPHRRQVQADDEAAGRSSRRSTARSISASPTAPARSRRASAPT